MASLMKAGSFRQIIVHLVRHRYPQEVSRLCPLYCGCSFQKGSITPVNVRGFRTDRWGIRASESSATPAVETKTVTVTETKSSSTAVDTRPAADVQVEGEYSERYIPITRRSVIRHLIQQENFLLEEEKKKLEDFALALDSAIVNKYHGVLQELKNLFDPLNPDKDTIQTRKWTPRERLDNEFWLLQRLEDVMEKANFHELEKDVVKKALQEREVSDAVSVKVDPDRYDILRFWALGKEKPPVTLPVYKRLLHTLMRRQPPRHQEYYKRVVVAIRLKRDMKLTLKSFKEIPVGSIEMLLPDGKIQMRTFDRRLIATSVGIAALGILTKLATYLAHYNIDWTLVLSGITGFIAVSIWSRYKNTHNRYLAELSRLLYFKNVANNRGLLALLVDRAEDESFKEALLVYTFLLTNRAPSTLKKPVNEQEATELGGIEDLQLEKNIEEWIYKKTKVKVEFDASEAIKLLQKFGILSDLDDKLHVLPLDAAMRNLPQQPQSLVARATESDISEGYDRDEFLETEEQYKKQDEIAKKSGWF